jgi:hypothetical protein
MPCRRRDRRISEATVPAHQFLDIVVVPRLMRKFADAMSCKNVSPIPQKPLGRVCMRRLRSAAIAVSASGSSDFQYNDGPAGKCDDGAGLDVLQCAAVGP